MFCLHRFATSLAWMRCRLRWSRSGASPDLTCKQVVGLIADYLTGAIDPETAAAFEAHLQGCDHCIAFLNTYKQTITAVRSLRCEDLPAELETRVRDFLGARVRRSGDDRWPPSGPAQSLIGRLLARLRRLSTGSESTRVLLVSLVAAWTC